MELRAVIGSGIFSRRHVRPETSFRRSAAHPYQFDRRTSPEPLPGTITALLTVLIVRMTVPLENSYDSKGTRLNSS